jgi:hypothetical protein
MIVCTAAGDGATHFPDPTPGPPMDSCLPALGQKVPCLKQRSDRDEAKLVNARSLEAYPIHLQQNGASRFPVLGVAAGHQVLVPLLTPTVQ